MVDIKKFMYCISMFVTKTISLICTFPLKNKRFFIILPTKLINLNCTASQKFQSKHIFFLTHFSANIPIIKTKKLSFT